MRLASPAVIGAGLMYVPKLFLRVVETAMTRRDVDTIAEEAVTLRFAETAGDPHAGDRADRERHD
jgi:hypothetical protein